MCVNLSPRGLNPSPCLPHLTSTYTCGMTNSPRVCSSFRLKVDEYVKLKPAKMNL